MSMNKNVFLENKDSTPTVMLYYKNNFLNEVNSSMSVGDNHSFIVDSNKIELKFCNNKNLLKNDLLEMNLVIGSDKKLTLESLQDSSCIFYQIKYGENTSTGTSKSPTPIVINEFILGDFLSELELDEIYAYDDNDTIHGNMEFKVTKIVFLQNSTLDCGDFSIQYCQRGFADSSWKHLMQSCEDALEKKTTLVDRFLKLLHSDQESSHIIIPNVVVEIISLYIGNLLRINNKEDDIIVYPMITGCQNLDNVNLSGDCTIIDIDIDIDTDTADVLQ